MLHFDKFHTTEAESPSATVMSTAATKIVLGLGSNVLISTARVGVKTSSGSFIVVRALLDSASQLSFATSDLVKRIGANTSYLLWG